MDPEKGDVPRNIPLLGALASCNHDLADHHRR